MGKSYRQSPHMWTYIWIGLKHFTSPQKVYDLAHGVLEMHKKDRPIMHDLKEYDIIHHKKGYHSH